MKTFLWVHNDYLRHPEIIKHTEGTMKNELNISTNGNPPDAVIVDGVRYVKTEKVTQAEVDRLMLARTLLSSDVRFAPDSHIADALRRSNIASSSYSSLRMRDENIRQAALKREEREKAARNLAKQLRNDPYYYFVQGSAIDDETKLLAPEVVPDFAAKQQAEDDRQAGKKARLTPKTTGNPSACPSAWRGVSYDFLRGDFAKGPDLVFFDEVDQMVGRANRAGNRVHIDLENTSLRPVRVNAEGKLVAGWVRVLVDALKEADREAAAAGYPVNAHGKLLEQLAKRDVPCK